MKKCDFFNVMYLMLLFALMDIPNVFGNVAVT